MSWWVGGSLRTCSFYSSEASFQLLHPQKKNCVCVCDEKKSACLANLGFRVGYACVRLILVLVWGTYYVPYVCTWYQPAEITSCEKHSMVVYIHEPYPWPRAWSLDDRWRLRAGGREQLTVLSGTSTIGHGLHVVDRAQGFTGTQSGVRCRAQPG